MVQTQEVIQPREVVCTKAGEKRKHGRSEEGLREGRRAGAERGGGSR